MQNMPENTPQTSTQVTMEKIVSLAKQRGFVFPGSDIYGGLANSWDFGPLGAQLRQNLKRLWWQDVVERQADVVGLDGAILMNPKVWQASGHTETFNDPLIDCKSCNTRFRADKVSFMADDGSEVAGTDVTESNLASLACSNCKEHTLTTPRKFNLMFQTTIGPVQEDGSVVYLRPETAQAMFVNFKNVLNTSRIRLPFGMAQIGKAFRNEITPGNFIFRTLEFEQMEIEYFVEPTEWEPAFAKWQQWMTSWATKIGLDMNKFSEYEVPADDLAHYSKRTIDFEFLFPFGSEEGSKDIGKKDELWGLAYRTDFDLTNHTTHSGEKLEYTDPNDNARKVTPHVIEPSMGVDRTLLAVLISAYNEEEVTDDKGNVDTRVVMKFTKELAPYQVAVLPLMKKSGLAEKAQEVFESLLVSFRCEYDETQSIGKRYRRQDEIGTLYCVTIDFDTIEKPEPTVTVRHRDTMEQDTILLADLQSYLATKLA